MGSITKLPDNIKYLKMKQLDNGYPMSDTSFKTELGIPYFSNNNVDPAYVSLLLLLNSGTTPFAAKSLPREGTFPCLSSTLISAPKCPVPLYLDGKFGLKDAEKCATASVRPSKYFLKINLSEFWS
ncbi:hypothetical protein Bbelb_086240 [Branchiostoma belcheri]|nr:hypothetical protein Bbelb_086240 [Branchiostoma belcheri]